MGGDQLSAAARLSNGVRRLEVRIGRMSSLLAIRSSPKVMNGSDQAADLELSCDVCIIGSGAGGAVTAATLADKEIDVLIVEEGGYFTHTDFTMREKDVVTKLYQEAMQRTT